MSESQFASFTVASVCLTATLVDLITSTLYLITVLPRFCARGNDIRCRIADPYVRTGTAVNYFDRTNFLVNYPDIIIITTVMYYRLRLHVVAVQITMKPCYIAK